MTEVIEFPAAGNGAREALTEIETLMHPGSICWAEWLLLELGVRGFKIVPIDDSRLADADILHDCAAKLHAAAALHPSEYWAGHLRKAAERPRENYKLASEVAMGARRAAGISNPEVYAACSAAQTAAIRVVDAIEDQKF